jgi:hypothetical protein
MQLVYLSPVPWDSFAQRAHMFVEWFHEASCGQVLWVDPYPTRLPSWKDLWVLREERRGGEHYVPQWLRVIVPRYLPIEPVPASGLVNGVFWEQTLSEIMLFSRDAPTLIGIGKPSELALQLLLRVEGSISFYDAMDNFPAFYSGISRSALMRREIKLVERVTQVFVSSTALLKRWQRVKSNVKLIHNGLAVDVLPNIVPYKEVRPKKVFGYVGTIGEWFDWDWLIALARTRPDNLIRLIGPVFSPADRQLPSNVEILPPCAHVSALEAMTKFDVGLIPFKKNQLTDSVDPIKYYEYRALGLPVVSTRFGEMELRGKEWGTYLSDGADDVIAPIDAALTYRVDEQGIREFRTANSWRTRFAATGIITSA